MVIRAEVGTYIVEEVRRQGHNVRDPVDGGLRIAWMAYAWGLAEATQDLTIEFVERLGRLVEPAQNRNGFRTVRVRVGERECPQPEEILPRLTRLWEAKGSLSPLEFYREFEITHPFRDGNGRVGKIILNHLNGSLPSPIFPPHDFWGEPIRNP